MNKKHDQYDCRNSVLFSGIAIAAIIFFITLVFPSYPKIGSNGIAGFICVLFPLISCVCFYLFHDPDIQKQKSREPTTPCLLRDKKPIRVGVIPGPIYEVYGKDKMTAVEAAKYLKVNPNKYVVYCENGLSARIQQEDGERVTDNVVATRGELLLLLKRIA